MKELIKYYPCYFPRSMLYKYDAALNDLVGQLLDKDPEMRLGAKDLREILQHEWFD